MYPRWKKNRILDFDILVTNNLEKILNVYQSIYQTTPRFTSNKLNELFLWGYQNTFIYQV